MKSVLLSQEEEYGKDNEENPGLNPSRDSATNQIRKKEPQVTTTTHYNHMGTKYNEAKTNRSPTRGSEFSAKSDVLHTSLNSTSQQVAESDAEDEMSLPSQTGTKLPPHSVEGTSASLNDGSKTLFVFPQMNLSGTAESLNMVSITEYQELSTDIGEEENLLTDFRLDRGDDSSGSSPATSTVPFFSDNISHGYISSSEMPDAITYNVLKPGSTRSASEDSASSGSEESLKGPSPDGSVWFPGSTDLTTQPETGSGRESFLQGNSTDLHIDESGETTESFSPGAAVSQGPSVTDTEVPHYSTLAYLPTEVTPHAFTPSSRPLDLAPTLNVLHSQTTQPVYNGETPLQPPHSSEAFPLVTPLLLDNQTLNTTPAASSSDSALHATPVFPSVGVSFDSILSSYGGAPLPPFSSASFSSELFRHLHTVSQTLPQVPSAAERATLSLHASLLVAGGDVLLEPSLVVPHQATAAAAASETLEFGSEPAVLYKASMVSQIESLSSDVIMHAYSSGPEASHAFEGSHHVLTLSSSSAIPVHESVGVADQGPLLISPSQTLMPGSSLVTPTATLLQSPTAFSGDEEWSGASSDSELLLPDTDGLRTINISSPVSVAEFSYATSVFGDDVKPRSRSEVMYGNETELKMSSVSEMGYHSESRGMPKMSAVVDKWDTSFQETSVPTSSINTMFPESLAYPATKVFDHEISHVPENSFPVSPAHTASQALGDAWLKPALSANSEPAFSDPVPSEVLHPSAQPLLPEAASPFNTEALLQPSFQASDVDTLLKTALPSVPSAPGLTETPKAEQSSSSMLHPMASESASSGSTLHLASAPALDVSPSNMHSTSLQGLTVPYTSEKYSEQGLRKSTSPQQVLPSVYSNDELFHTAHPDSSRAFAPQEGHAFATPVISIDGPQNTLLDKLVYSEDVSMLTESSITYKVLAGLPTLVSDGLVSTDHSVSLESGSISISTVSPSRDVAVTTATLHLPSKSTSELTHSTSSDADLVGGEEGDDYGDDYDIDSDRFPINKCMSCSPYRESQEKVTNDSDTQENSPVDQSDPISHLLFENPEEENRGAGVTSVDKSPDKSPATTMLPQKNNGGKEDSNISLGSAVLPVTPKSKAWRVLTSNEESGSGQGTSDSLSDNETPADFSFPDVNDKDADGVLEADNTGVAPGSPRSSTPSVNSGHSEVSNSSEAG